MQEFARTRRLKLAERLRQNLLRKIVEDFTILSRNWMIMRLPRQGSNPFALRAIGVYAIGVGGCGLQVLRRRFRRTWWLWGHHAERVESGNSDPGRIGYCEATERPSEKPE